MYWLSDHVSPLPGKYENVLAFKSTDESIHVMDRNDRYDYFRNKMPLFFWTESKAF